LETQAKEQDISELLKAVDEQIRKSANHVSGDFSHSQHIQHIEEHRSSVPMLDPHQSHVVETVKRSAHVFNTHEPVHAQNSDRDLSPSSKSIFLGQTWRQSEPTNHHSSDAHLISDVRNSVKLYSIETKKDQDILHTPRQESDTFHTPSAIDVHFTPSKNLFETPKKSFVSPSLYSGYNDSASKDWAHTDSTAKLLAEIKAEFSNTKFNDVNTHHQVSQNLNHHIETPSYHHQQIETPSYHHHHIETPAHHHRRDDNEPLATTMKNMSGTISYIDNLISDLKNRHEKLNNRYSKAFGPEVDQHHNTHHVSSSTAKVEEEKIKKSAKAPQKVTQEKHHSNIQDDSKKGDYSWVKALFAALVILLLGVIFNQIVSIGQDLLE